MHRFSCRYCVPNPFRCNENTWHCVRRCVPCDDRGGFVRYQCLIQVVWTVCTEKIKAMKTSFHTSLDTYQSDGVNSRQSREELCVTNFKERSARHEHVCIQHHTDLQPKSRWGLTFSQCAY